MNIKKAIKTGVAIGFIAGLLSIIFALGNPEITAATITGHLIGSLLVANMRKYSNLQYVFGHFVAQFITGQLVVVGALLINKVF